ncbi:MAG: hypothetical protein SVZ03_12945 [Spirochaetota bacterium]|nr:hypothetical protein [Spirochaetota bacterium]
MIRYPIYKIILGLILICLPQGCYEMPQSIPIGKWSYRLLVNNVEMGSALISNSIVEGNYISTSELKFSTGNITNTNKQIITETKEFKPVKLQTHNKTLTGDNVYETITVSVFNDRNVDVKITTGKEKTTNNAKITLGKDSILDGNFFLSKLIEGKFKSGLEIEANIYDPSIELEEPIITKVKVIGLKNIEVDGKDERLIHISQSIENIKSIDFFIDSAGIMRKGVIEMLNIRIELIRNIQ